MKKRWWIAGILLLGLLNIVAIVIDNKNPPTQSTARSEPPRVSGHLSQVGGEAVSSSTDEKHTDENTQVRDQKIRRLPKTHVSQVQIDIVKKKEAARKRVEEMMRMRTETIRAARQEDMKRKEQVPSEPQ
jgi:hypothetical protein